MNNDNENKKEEKLDLNDCVKDSKDMKNTERRSLGLTIFVYSICVLIALLIAFLIASSNGAFKGVAKRTLYGILSDSFFGPGVLYICVGVLLKISESGFFDSITFILKRAFFSLIPGGRIRLDSNYKEYKKSKEEKRKKARYSSVFIVGLVFIALSVIFLLLYSNTKI
ncbi:MAG: DUF3899 domain-containing protein [Clostridia bacterium]|nr:DUF3899 domain-containing protein [Clostridia bacterium]MBQ4099703.1 DUF3899 domain-containing protein [Clostridia bacterium]